MIYFAVVVDKKALKDKIYDNLKKNHHIEFGKDKSTIGKVTQEKAQDTDTHLLTKLRNSQKYNLKIY